MLAFIERFFLNRYSIINYGKLGVIKKPLKVLQMVDFYKAWFPGNGKFIPGKLLKIHSREFPGNQFPGSITTKNLKRNVCLEMPICYHFDFSVQLVNSRNLFSQTQYFGIFYCPAGKKWQGINRSTNKKYTGCKY